MIPSGTAYNRLLTGLIIGIVIPLITLVVIYFVSFADVSLVSFFEALAARKKISSLLSLSVIPNLLLFFIFIWLDYLYSARGVLFSTIIFAIIVLVLKLIF